MNVCNEIECLQQAGLIGGVQVNQRIHFPLNVGRFPLFHVEPAGGGAESRRRSAENIYIDLP
jgi:hypothetical protein